MIVEGLAIALGISLVGFVLSRVRGARSARVERQTLGQQPHQLSEGDYLVWPMRWLSVARRPARVRVERGQVSWLGADRLQPDWEAPADRVRARALPATFWVELGRVRLQPPDATPVTVLVSREAQRPAGPLDPAYQRRLAAHFTAFLETLRANGSTID